jgi:undecaprenyl-diphosphatase
LERFSVLRKVIYSIFQPDPSRFPRSGEVLVPYLLAAASALTVLLLLFYWDQEIRQWFLSIRTPEMYRAMKGISLLGLGGYQAVLAVLLLGIGYYFKDPRHYRAGLYGLYAVILAGILVQAVKHLVGRPRPRLVEKGIETFAGPTLASGFDSFPSGHSITAFSMAVILSGAYPRWRVLFYSLAALIALSRVYLGAHFPSDVFAGAVLGVAVGMFLRFRFFPKPVHLV